VTNANFESEICNRKFLARNLDDDLSTPPIQRHLRCLHVSTLQKPASFAVCLTSAHFLAFGIQYDSHKTFISHNKFVKYGRHQLHRV
jgi:hypothetical protein